MRGIPGSEDLGLVLSGGSGFGRPTDRASVSPLVVGIEFVADDTHPVLGAAARSGSRMGHAPDTPCRGSRSMNSSGRHGEATVAAS